MKKIAVFASGSGSNLQSIIDAVEAGTLQVQIAFVLSNNSKAFSLERARKADIQAVHFSRKQFETQEAYDQAMLKLLQDNSVDIIALAGYMKLIPANVVQAYRGGMVNVHPALLPKFGGKGMYGMNVHTAVIDAKEKESGASIHFVTEVYDEGPVILQERIPVLEDDTPESLAERVLVVEHRIYPLAIQKVASGEAAME